VAGGLILVVEDDTKSLELVRDLLAVTGYRTLEARSAAAGTALAAARRPDLVVMDVRLPDGDGVAALRRLRATPGLATTPVLAVTAFAMREDRERLLAAGFDGYVSKPIELRAFLDAVRRNLRPGVETGGRRPEP
jgi:two-component system cell cycle response regulator DivK